MNNNDFIIENKFINNDNNKKKRNKIIPIILLLLLIALLVFLVYQVKFAKKDSDKKSDEYSEYDPDYPLESEGHIKQEDKQSITSNITEVITSNVTSNIKVTSNTIKSNSNVTSNNNSNSNIKVNGVKLDKTSVAIKVGGTTNLVATINPSNSTNKNVTWSSSNTGVATVDKNGKVIGIKAGKAVITVTTKDGGYKATATITVSTNVINVSSVTISPSGNTTYVGSTLKYVAKVSPSNATNNVVTWKLSDTSVASMNASGNNLSVKCLKAGTSVISATADGKTYNGSITCKNKISLSSTSGTLYAYAGGGRRDMQYSYIKIDTTENYKNIKVTGSNLNLLDAVLVNSNYYLYLAPGNGIGTSKITLTTSDKQSVTYALTVNKYTVSIDRTYITRGGHSVEVASAQIYNVKLNGTQVKNSFVQIQQNTYPAGKSAGSLGLGELPTTSYPNVIVNNVSYPAIFVES